MSGMPVLRIALGMDTLVIGPRGALGGLSEWDVNGRPALHSKEEVRHLLRRAFADASNVGRLRQAMVKWDDGNPAISRMRDSAVVDRLVQKCFDGALVPWLQVGLGGGNLTSSVEINSSFLADAKDASIESMGLSGRAAQVLQRAPNYMSAALREQFNALMTPQAIATAVVVLAVWAVGHAFGPSQVVDALLFGAGIYLLGTMVFDIAKKIGQIAGIISSARTDEELETGAQLLADVIAAVGVVAFVALITHAAAKGTKGTFGKVKEPVRRTPPPSSEKRPSFQKRRHKYPMTVPQLRLPSTIAKSLTPKLAQLDKEPNNAKPEWKTELTQFSLKAKTEPFYEKKYGHNSAINRQDEEISEKTSREMKEKIEFDLTIVSIKKDEEIWKSKDGLLRLVGMEGTIRAGVFDREGSLGVKGNLSGDLTAGLFGQAKVAIITAEFEGKKLEEITNGLVHIKAGGEVGSVSAALSVGYKQTADFKGAEIEGGLEAVAVKGEISGSLNVSPKSIYDNTIGQIVRTVTNDENRGHLDEKWNHGVKIGLTGEAGIGAAAKASARAGYIDGIWGVTTGGEIGAGPMAGFKALVGVY